MFDLSQIRLCREEALAVSSETISIKHRFRNVVGIKTAGSQVFLSASLVHEQEIRRDSRTLRFTTIGHATSANADPPPLSGRQFYRSIPSAADSFAAAKALSCERRRSSKVISPRSKRSSISRFDTCDEGINRSTITATMPSPPPPPPHPDHVPVGSIRAKKPHVKSV